PDGVLEEIVFRQILHASWNLERVSRLEADLFQDPSEQLLSNEYARLARYRVMHERAFHRNLKELKLLQTCRAVRDQTPAPAAPPPMADVTSVAKQTLHNRFAEIQPILRAMQIETQHLNEQVREAKLHHAADPPKAA